MIYKGSRLQALVTKNRGYHAELSAKLAARNNAKSYNLTLLYKDGRNLQLSTLTDLLQATGLPVDYFIDFEPSELPTRPINNASGNRSNVHGSNNIVNSLVASDLTMKIEHLNEVIALKDQLIESKEALIQMWQNKYNELADQLNTTKK